jgi:type II secretion system protein N
MMNNQKTTKPNIDYSLGFLKSPKFIIVAAVIFTLTLLSNLTVKERLNSLIYSSLTGIPGCPIEFSDYRVEFFFPKIILDKVNIKKSCIRSLSENLKIKELSLSFTGLSFSPFGPSFKVRTEVFSSKIEAAIVPSFSSFAILLASDTSTKANIINLDSLSSLIPNVKLAGDINITAAHIDMSYQKKLNDLTLNITSKNFTIPAQTIILFKIEEQPINSFLLQITSTNKSKLKINKLILGDEKSPLIADFSGDLALNMRQPRSSKINIKGELSLSDKFLEKYAFIQMYMNQFDKKDKFYQIQVKGPLTRPKLSSAR